MRRASGRVPALAVLAAVGVLAATSARADLVSAMADFKAGRYLEAAAELQAIVDRSPGDAYGYFLLGHCALRMGRPADAELQFRRALMLDATKAAYFQGLALAFSAEAKWGRAVQVANDGLVRAKDPAEQFGLLTARGVAWEALGRLGDAARDFEAAQRIRPESWILLHLGKAYFAIHEYDRAIVVLRDALEAAPDDPVALRLLIESLLQRAGAEPDPERKRVLYADALETAQELARLATGDPDVAHIAGRAALGAGKLELAENLFHYVLALEPRQCYAMINLGRTYIALTRWDDAEAILRQAAACAPRLPVVFETLGSLYMSRGLTREAAAMFQRAEQIDPSRSDPLYPGTRPPPPTISVGNPR